MQDGSTPLMIATLNGLVEVVRALIGSPLMVASLDGNVEVVRPLIGTQARLNSQDKV